LVSSFGNNGNDKRNGTVVDRGVISVVNINELPQHSNEQAISYLAHFVAHTTGVSYASFGTGGRLLFTANELATTFNIFLLHPHPVSCRLGSIQHIYTLHRGSSAAKVI
jgi:hypothetical protein